MSVQVNFELSGEYVLKQASELRNLGGRQVGNAFILIWLLVLLALSGLH